MLFLDEICNLCELGKALVFIKSILNIVLFIVPMLLTVMISLDFLKSVISNSEEDMRKNVSIVIKRLIAVVILFLLPSIINITASILDYAGVKAGTYYKLATAENLSTDMFKELDKEYFKSTDIPENIKNQGSSSQGGNKQKVISPSKTVSSTANFKLRKNFIVLANIKNTKGAKKYNLIKYTIEVLNSKNQKLPITDFIYKSENPGIATVSANGEVKARFGGTTNIIVTSKKNKNQSTKLKVTVIHSLYTKVKTTKALKVTNLATGKTTSLPKGTKGVYNGLAQHEICEKKNYLEGNILKVGNAYYSVDVDSVKHYNYHIDSKLDQKTVEEFINYHGFKSKTKYLFWTNEGTEHEYIFYGSKGNWKLHKVFKISTGDALSYHASNCSTCCGTGMTPDHYWMGTKIVHYAVNQSYPNGYIHKNDGSSGYHEGGKGYPKTRGCTAFKSKDFKWITSNHSKLKRSQIVSI